MGTPLLPLLTKIFVSCFLKNLHDLVGKLYLPALLRCSYCKITTTISLINIYHHYSYKLFFLVIRTHKIYSFISNFQSFNIVLLAIVTMLYTASLLHTFCNWKCVTFDPTPRQPPICSLCHFFFLFMATPVAYGNFWARN